MKIVSFFFSILVLLVLSSKNQIFSQERFFNWTGVQSPSSIKVTSDDCIIFCGSNTDTIKDKSVGWIVKLTRNLKDTIFCRNYGLSSRCSLNYIIEASDSNYIAVGSDSARGAWILKINKNGDTIFSKYYDTIRSTLTYIYETKQGNFIATGIKNNSNGDRGWILKINSDFTTKLIDSSYSDCYSIIFARELNDTGDSILVIGHFSSNRVGADIGLRKLNNKGDILFSKVYGDTSCADSIGQITGYKPFAAFYTSDSNYIITGSMHTRKSFNHDSLTLPKNLIFLLKINNQCDSIWFKYYGESAKANDKPYAEDYGTGNCIIETYDKNYLIAGQLAINFNDGHNGYYNDAVLLKIDTAGNIIKEIYWYGPGSLHEFGNSVAENNCSYIVASEVNENMYGTAGDARIFSVDKNNLELFKFPELSLISPNGGEILKAEETFQIKWESKNIICIKIEYSYDSGNNWNTVAILDSIWPNISTINWIVPEIDSKNCIIRISDCNGCVIDISDSLFTTPVNEEKQNNFNHFVIFPNPCTNTSEIIYTLEKSSRISLTISNNLGIEIERFIDNEYIDKNNTKRVSFDTSELTSGIYFITIRAGNYTETQKFIVIK